VLRRSWWFIETVTAMHVRSRFSSPSLVLFSSQLRRQQRRSPGRMPSRALCRLRAVFAVDRPGQLELINIAAASAALLGELVTHALSVWESAWLFIRLFKSREVAAGHLMVLVSL